MLNNGAMGMHCSETPDRYIPVGIKLGMTGEVSRRDYLALRTEKA